MRLGECMWHFSALIVRMISYSLLITLRDGGLWAGRVGSAECQRPPITMATSVLSQQEVLRQLHLRRHIDELKRNVEEREQAVHKNR